MSADLTQLDPSFLPEVQEFTERCTNAGLHVNITVTWRGAAAQDLAKANGLSKAGAGQSPHNCIDAEGNPAARAIDFAVLDDKGNYIKNGTDPRYRQAGEIAESLGLFWAGRWTEILNRCEPDWDHIQMRDWKNGALFPQRSA